MNIFRKLINSTALFSLQIPTPFDALENIYNIDSLSPTLKAGISCSIEGSACSKFEFNPFKCKRERVVYEFELCNADSSVPITVESIGAKINQVPVNLNFDGKKLNKGSCMIKQHSIQANMCLAIIPWAIIWAKGIDNNKESYQVYTSFNDKVSTCELDTSITCTVKSNGYPCEDIIVDPMSDCLDIQTVVETKICNRNLENSLSITYSSRFNGGEKVRSLPGIDSILARSTCQVDYKPFVFNSCTPEKVWGSIAAWGQSQRLQCYDYKYLHVSTKVPPAQFIVRPLAKCVIDSSGESCEDFLEYERDSEQCIDNVKWTFQVENVGVTCKSINNITVNLNSGGPMPVSLGYNTVLCPNNTLEIYLLQFPSNICFLESQNATFHLEVNGQKPLLQAHFDVSKPKQISTLQTSQPLKCIVDDGTDVSCVDYMKYLPVKSCNVDIKYELYIKNIGIRCEDIKYVDALRDGETQLTVPLKDRTYQERYLCPSSFWSFIIYDKMNLCSFAGKSLVVGLTVNKRNKPFNISVNIPDPFSPNETPSSQSLEPSIQPTGYCGVALAIMCWASLDRNVGNDKFSVPCAEINTTLKKCKRTVKYRYIIKNKETDRNEVITKLMSNSENRGAQNILRKEFTLKPGEVKKKTIFIKVNFCKKKDKVIETIATVGAKTTDGIFCERTKKKYLMCLQ